MELVDYYYYLWGLAFLYRLRFRFRFHFGSGFIFISVRVIISAIRLQIFFIFYRDSFLDGWMGSNCVCLFVCVFVDFCGFLSFFLAFNVFLDIRLEFWLFFFQFRLKNPKIFSSSFLSTVSQLPPKPLLGRNSTISPPPLPLPPPLHSIATPNPTPTGTKPRLPMSRTTILGILAISRSQAPAGEIRTVAVSVVRAAVA